MLSSASADRRRRRCHSNRHTVAAAARFSDSAWPVWGTRTLGVGRSHDVVGKPVRLVAEHEHHRPREVGTVQVGRRPAKPSRAPGRRARGRGRWHRASRRPAPPADGRPSPPRRARSWGCRRRPMSRRTPRRPTRMRRPSAARCPRSPGRAPRAGAPRSLPRARARRSTRSRARHRGTPRRRRAPWGVTVEVRWRTTPSATDASRHPTAWRAPPAGRRRRS